MTKKKPFSSARATRCWSKEVIQSSPNAEGVKTRTETSAEMKKAVDATPPVSRTLHPEVKFAVRILEISVRKFYFVKNLSSNDLKEPHSLKTDFALSKTIIISPPTACRALPVHSIRSAPLSMCFPKRKSKTL